MLVVDTHTALLVQIELFNKKLVENSLAKANVSQVQALTCDLCGEGMKMDDVLWEDQVKRLNFLISRKVTLIPTLIITDGKVIRI